MSVRRWLAGAIVAICLIAPIAETFDSWDHTAQDGNDSEANLIVIAVCVGMALSAAVAVITRIRSLASASPTYRPTSQRVVVPQPWLTVPIPASSPPAPLRV